MSIRWARAALAALAAITGLGWAAADPARAAGREDVGSRLVALSVATIEPTVLSRMAAPTAEALGDPASTGRSGSAAGGSSSAGEAPTDGAASRQDGEPSGAVSSMQLARYLAGPAVATLEFDAVAAASLPSEHGWLAAVAPRTHDVGLLLAAQASLLIDMAQTMEIRRTSGVYESNRLLGERPGDGVVVAYFGSIAALHAAAYAAIPGRWANWLSRGILFVEIPAIDTNSRIGIRVQF
jgi:hypothetical protein